MNKDRMTQIRSVKIENFQSHENTVLDFSDGLNVIVGPSDQGKSAIIRAIKWVLYNEPRGLEFIKHGAAFARVTLEMSTGYKIVRERSKSKNRYVTIDPDGNEAVFEGFGNDIPKEVINAHGIPKVMLDADISSSLNISEQLEGPFLLSETGTVRAKAIGRLIGIHLIDNANRDSMTDLRRENQTADRLNNELKGVNSRLEDYKELDDIKDRLELSGNLISNYENKLERLRKLSKIQENLVSVDIERKKVKENLDKLQNLHKCDETVNKCIMHLQNIKNSIRLDSSFKELGAQLARVHGALERTREYENCKEVLAGIEGLVEKHSRLARLKVILKDIAKEENEVSDRMEKTKNIDELLKNVSTSDISVKNYKLLISLRERLESCNIEIRKIDKYSKIFDKIDYCIHSVDLLDKKLDRLGKLVIVKDEYAVISNFISEGLKFKENNSQQIKKLTDEYVNTLRRTGICPSCGSEISELKIDEIIRHYKEEH